MSLPKIKTATFCTAGCQYAGTRAIEGAITPNGGKLLVGECVICNKKTNVCL